MLVQLPPDPRELVGLHQPGDGPGNLRVEAEAEPVAGAEGEGHAVEPHAARAVAEDGPQRRAVVVVPRHLPETVEPRLQDLPDRAVGLGQLVVRVVTGDDEVVDAPGVLLDVRDDLAKHLPGGDAVQARVRVGKDVQVGDLDDARHRGVRHPSGTTPLRP